MDSRQYRRLFNDLSKKIDSLSCLDRILDSCRTEIQIDLSTHLCIDKSLIGHDKIHVSGI